MHGKSADLQGGPQLGRGAGLRAGRRLPLRLRQGLGEGLGVRSLRLLKAGGALGALGDLDPRCTALIGVVGGGKEGVRRVFGTRGARTGGTNYAQRIRPARRGQPLPPLVPPDSRSPSASGGLHATRPRMHGAAKGAPAVGRLDGKETLQARGVVDVGARDGRAPDRPLQVGRRPAAVALLFAQAPWVVAGEEDVALLTANVALVFAAARLAWHGDRTYSSNRCAGSPGELVTDRAVHLRTRIRIGSAQLQAGLLMALVKAQIVARDRRASARSQLGPAGSAVHPTWEPEEFWQAPLQEGILPTLVNVEDTVFLDRGPPTRPSVTENGDGLCLDILGTIFLFSLER